MKTNIAELLRGCPKGMELDCTMFENVHFERIEKNVDYPIIIRIGKTDIIRLTKYGCWNKYSNAKCVIFPKGKTTWEGFVPPYQFKDGDIVYIKTKGYYHNEFIIIFKEIKNDHIHKHACFAYQVLYTEPNAVCHLVDIEEIRIATEEEKQKLFQAIKDNGYKWNAETKTLEKLIEPNFKVGDRIQSKYFIEERTIKICEEDGYWTTVDTWIRISDQDDWELIPNKFDIATLKPFDKVLVRDGNKDKWNIDFEAIKGNHSQIRKVNEELDKLSKLL